MNYEEALNYIHGAYKFGSKLGLENIRKLLELMGNPQDKLRFVHIAGTNGKGSTSAFISNILKEAGYKTGLYTSPYIERFTERIKIDGVEISGDDLARVTEFVAKKVEIMVSQGYRHPTEFEIVTSIAFQYYYEKGCDVVVLEVGLGGRFDATNVIKTPEVAVITAIAMDHMEILGDTVEKIAMEKAGIIKPNGHVVVYPQDENIINVFKEISEKNNCRIIIADKKLIELKEFNADGQTFNYGSLHSLKTRLIGRHQLNNAAVAIETANILQKKGWKINEDVIRRGIANAVWAGRLEVLKKDPLFIIDGAHNPHGALALTNTLMEYFPEKRKIFIIGVLKDKDYKQLVEAAAGMAYCFITVTPDSPRALAGDKLAEFIKSYCENVVFSDTIEKAIEISSRIASKDDLICAFGSLYYRGEVRQLVLNK